MRFNAHHPPLFDASEAAAPRRISITAFGAVSGRITNNQAAIQRTFTYAAANGMSVYIPRGDFAYSGTLTANGIAVSGAGSSSILRAQSGAHESLILTGTGASIADLQLVGTGSARLSDPEAEMIWAFRAQHYLIRNVLIDGSSNGGIMSEFSHHGQILNNTVKNTLADSITCIHGSSDIMISGNRILRSGDDGISVVSYTDAPLVHDITIKGNTVLNNLWGRGITDVGGNNVEIMRNYIEGGPAGLANIYIAAEAQWSTQGVDNVLVSENTLVDGGGTPAGTGQGAITIYNSQGARYTLRNVVLRNNQIANPLSQALQFVGDGPERVIAENNTVYTDGDQLTSNGNPAADVTLTGNRMLRAAEYDPRRIQAKGR